VAADGDGVDVFRDSAVGAGVVGFLVTAEFFVGRLGAAPADRMDLPDWLLPTQILASLTGGMVLNHILDLLTTRRGRWPGPQTTSGATL